MEKARASAILGVLVGTLASAGLQAALAHLRRLVGAAGKRSYTVLVGKPNPAKLANFPEVCAGRGRQLWRAEPFHGDAKQLPGTCSLACATGSAC